MKNSGNRKNPVINRKENMGSRSSPCQNPALAVLHPIMTCTIGRWDAAPGHYCSQHPSIVKAWTGGLQTEQEI